MKKTKNLDKLSYDELMKQLKLNLELLKDSDTGVEELTRLVEDSKMIYTKAQERLKAVKTQLNDILEPKDEKE